MDNILELRNLSLSFTSPEGTINAVRGVTLEIRKGEILAIVGESGCGKSVMCQSVMKLLPKNSRIDHGEIILDGIDITHFSERQMRKIRGKKVSMVFQDPMTTLNPTIPIGKQITEAILIHNKISREEAKKRAIALLDLIGIDDPTHRYFLQPHFFSGGMRQRCVLAIALASNPKLLLADEPTTALDVMVQAKILYLLQKLRDELGLSIVFVSHDLGVVSRIADRVAVMYAGKIVEIGTVDEVIYNPQHPYTWGLMASHPSLVKRGEQLTFISGMTPVLINPPDCDMFAFRNKYAMKVDFEQMPPMFKISETHYSATWLLDPRASKIACTIPPMKKDTGDEKEECT